MKRSGVRTVLACTWGSGLRSNKQETEGDFPRVTLRTFSKNTQPLKTPGASLASALSQNGDQGAARQGARAPLRTILLRSCRSPPLPLASCSTLRVPSLTPLWRPPPDQAPEPGSGCGRSAEKTRGREKCFRGNGPRVGVCKLASVPARVAAAASLAPGA